MAVTSQVVFRDTATLQTTTTSHTSLIEIAIPDDCVAFIRYVIIGRQESTGHVAIYHISQGYQRSGGSAPTEKGTQTTDYNHEDDGGWDRIADISGNNARITVRGGTGDTVEWFCWAEAVYAVTT